MFAPEFGYAEQPRTYKLTPSMLTFLWDDCPRCFWLQARERLYRPRLPFPAVFGRYHDALQRFFSGGCPSELSESLPEGRFLQSEMWVESSRLTVPGTRATFFIKGRLDHVVRFRDGSYGVIDYKTTITRDVNVEKYARQLHAYAWALERPAHSSPRLAPVSRLGLLCVEPEDVVAFIRSHLAAAVLRPKWIEVERDDAAFEGFLARVVQLLECQRAPAASPDCAFCAYHAQLKRRDQPAREFGLPF